MTPNVPQPITIRIAPTTPVIPIFPAEVTLAQVREVIQKVGVINVSVEQPPLDIPSITNELDPDFHKTLRHNKGAVPHPSSGMKKARREARETMKHQQELIKKAQSQQPTQPARDSVTPQA